MKKFYKALFTCVLFVLASLPVFAADAKVTYVKGKVEVSRDGEWIQLNVGDVVNQSDMINTGFQSETRVNINGSVMAVPALTRVTLETLSTSDTKDSVSLYVSTGAVRSKVNHPENKKIEYTARTSVAVASVRGTDFTITAKGKVSCREGAVAVYPAKKYKAQTVETSETVEEAGEEVAEETAGADETVASTDQNESTAGDTADSGNNKSSDDKPATSTTAPSDISNDAPAGSVVVGAGQSTEFNSSGNPTKPSTDASQKSEKVKKQVSTQAEKAAESSETTTNTPVTTEPAKPKTGVIKITIEMPEA